MLWFHVLHFALILELLYIPFPILTNHKLEVFVLIRTKIPSGELDARESSLTALIQS